MSFQFWSAMINLNNFSPFSLIYFHLQNSSVEKTPQNNGKSQAGTLHITAHEPKGRASNMDVLHLEKSNSLLTDEN